ncbi:unnamed protein product [Sympodiomycopsis kandeliae]
MMVSSSMTTPPAPTSPQPGVSPVSTRWTSPRKAPKPPISQSQSQSTWQWKRPGDFTAEYQQYQTREEEEEEEEEPGCATPGPDNLAPEPVIQPRDESMGCLSHQPIKPASIRGDENQPSEKPPELPPALIPLDHEEMDIVMAAGYHSRTRNRSVTNRSDIVSGTDPGPPKSYKSVPQLPSDTDSGPKSYKSVPQLPSVTDSGPKSYKSVPQLPSVTDSGPKSYKSVPQLPSVTDSGPKSYKSVPQLPSVTDSGPKSYKSVPQLPSDTDSGPKSYKSVPQLHTYVSPTTPGSIGESPQSYKSQPPQLHTYAFPMIPQAGSIGESPCRPASKMQSKWSRLTTRRQEDEFVCADANRYSHSKSSSIASGEVTCKNSIKAVWRKRFNSHGHENRHRHSALLSADSKSQSQSQSLHSQPQSHSQSQSLHSQPQSHRWELASHQRTQSHIPLSTPSTTQSLHRPSPSTPIAFQSSHRPSPSTPISTQSSHRPSPSTPVSMSQSSHRHRSTSTASDYGRKKKDKRTTYVFDPNNLPPRTIASPTFKVVKSGSGQQTELFSLQRQQIPHRQSVTHSQPQQEQDDHVVQRQTSEPLLNAMTTLNRRPSSEILHRQSVTPLQPQPQPQQDDHVVQRQTSEPLLNAMTLSRRSSSSSSESSESSLHLDELLAVHRIKRQSVDPQPVSDTVYKAPFTASFLDVRRNSTDTRHTQESESDDYTPRGSMQQQQQQQQFQFPTRSATTTSGDGVDSCTGGCVIPPTNVTISPSSGTTRSFAHAHQSSIPSVSSQSSSGTRISRFEFPSMMDDIANPSSPSTTCSRSHVKNSSVDTIPMINHPYAFQTSVAQGHRRLKNSMDLLEKAALNLGMGRIDERAA